MLGDDVFLFRGGWTFPDCYYCSFDSIFADSKPAKYQDLPKKDGYVPVYIRVGNTPLEQINRDLAAAFQAANARSIRGTMIQVSLLVG